ncbi:hypothetical protein FKM82_025640, partial [Ascaphus truei]
QEKVKTVFDNLIQLEHLNIVKFHKYWADIKENKARVIFITEYMSSGSLKQFLKKTKKNHKTMNEKVTGRPTLHPYTRGWGWCWQWTRAAHTLNKPSVSIQWSLASAERVLLPKPGSL